MNVRVIGERQVNHGLSGLMSLALLLGCSLGSLALQPVILTSLARLEQLITGDVRPGYLEGALAVTAPALAISAMAAPLIMCYRAVQSGSRNHGLQWHLFAAFAFASTLGIVYGLRAGVMAIVYSNGCGLAIQLISLAAVWHLSENAWRFTTFVLQALPVPQGWKQNAGFYDFVHWWMYLSSIALIFGGVMISAFFMPINRVLGPLFTVTCVLPYVATFSTFPTDIISYRRWERLPSNSNERAEGPKGVDTTTLLTMQVNNILWNWYGMLIRDPAVLISSACSYFAAAIQIIVYLFPVIELTVRNKLIRLDPAYPFLGAKAFMTKSPKQTSGGLRPADEVSEKLSAVELMATVSNEDVTNIHNSEPPTVEFTLPRYETPVKVLRSEGLASQRNQPFEAPWSLFSTAHPIAPNPDI